MGKEEIIEERACTECGEIYPATTEYFYWRTDMKMLRLRCKKCALAYGKKHEYENILKDAIICEHCGKTKPKKRTYFVFIKKTKTFHTWCKNCMNLKNIKVCTECGCVFPATNEYFYPNRSIDGLTRLCKKCQSFYDMNYNENNKEERKEKGKEYYVKCNESHALFKTYAHQLTIDEDPKEGEDGYLLSKCAYCGRYFYPTIAPVQRRISSLLEQCSGECRLYCSDGCKDACPIFNQKLWPKGFKPASSREVDPLVRQMCLKRDDYECQKCGKTTEEAELHAHHIEGAVQQPLLANDVENTITLCKKCHKWVHKQKDCTYYDLRCKK